MGEGADSHQTPNKELDGPILGQGVYFKGGVRLYVNVRIRLGWDVECRTIPLHTYLDSKHKLQLFLQSRIEVQPLARMSQEFPQFVWPGCTRVGFHCLIFFNWVIDPRGQNANVFRFFSFQIYFFISFIFFISFFPFISLFYYFFSFSSLPIPRPCSHFFLRSRFFPTHGFYGALFSPFRLCLLPAYGQIKDAAPHFSAPPPVGS